MKILLIGTGGFLGAVLRYAASTWIKENWDAGKFPLATFTVNLVGCFLIGALYRLADEIPVLGKELHPFLFVGLLGGFTTFSTFGLELFHLHRNHGIGLSLLHGVASIAGGILLTWTGFVLVATAVKLTAR